MLKIYSISLGCPKNRVDTEKTLGQLGPSRMVDTVGKADLVFINTCGFIAPAITESVQVILEEAGEINRLRRKKKPLLVVAGCLVGRFGTSTIAPDLPEVDLFLESKDLDNWSAKILDLMQMGDPATDRILSTGPSYAYLKISEGCRHNCAFCTIPFIRGPLRSIPATKLEDEARLVLSKGVKEIILVAQDTTAWGMDFKPRSKFKSLVERLLPLQGLERLRIMYMYPAGLDDDILSFLKGAGAPFVPYFDIPVQHANPEVLKSMGRPFAQDPSKAIDRVRKYFPDAALRTSIITGFPGETDKAFKDLLRFVEQTHFHHLGVFSYQAEEGTVAAALLNQIEEEVKEQRKEAVMAVQKEISSNIMEQYVGQKLDVLVDAPSPEWPGLHVGRTWFQAPDVDGLTYISGPGVYPGAMIQAEITESTDYDLVALT